MAVEELVVEEHYNASDALENATDSIHGFDEPAHDDAHDTSFTVILFVLVAIMAGAAIQLFSSRYFKNLPFSPSVFSFGIFLAFIHHFVLEPENQLYMSIDRWENIDGHLLLNIFLPPLLMADSIHLDWHVAKRSAAQCILLAFPGVVLGAYLTAVVATEILPYNWGPELAWSFGAVLAATDPVAVVSMLKELGAPASITMIITGESLLNDGSSIVLWRFFFELHQHKRSLEAGALITFMLQLALGGAALGLGFGLVSLYSLSLASHKLEHTDVIVQVVLTIVLSYLCFYTAENILNVSGVLAVVVQGVFLSATFWPIVASRQTMEHVWHTVEWIYTTLLFTLAGLIVGSFLVGIESNCSQSDLDGSLCVSDLPWVVANYVLVVIIRLVTIFALLPLLRRMGYGLSVPGVLVCTWGGLRGAVGLALSLSMHGDLGATRTGKLIVLQVSGIALLTLLINAPLSPALLSWLRLTQPTETKVRLLHDIERRVHSYALELYLQLIKKDEWKLRSPAWEAKVVGSITALSKAVEERAKLERLQMPRHSKLSRGELSSLMLIAEEKAKRSSLPHKNIAERAYASIHLPNLHPHFPHLHLRAPNLHRHLPQLDPDKFPHMRIHLPHKIPHINLQLARSRHGTREVGSRCASNLEHDQGTLETVAGSADGVVGTALEEPQQWMKTRRSSTGSIKSRMPVLDAAIAPNAAPFDLSGDGIIDSVGFDTSGDGNIDTIGFDTTGDGFVDAVGFDSNGDGTIDSMEVLHHNGQINFADGSKSTESSSSDSLPSLVAGTPLLKAIKAKGAVALDLSGAGFTDSVGFDVNGDGKVDMIGLDTTGDGMLDSVGLDTNGDGMVDTIQPLSGNFTLSSYADAMNRRGTPSNCAGSSLLGAHKQSLLVDAIADPQAVPLDYSGDGIIDSVGYDTTGDGKVDLVCFDTTGDGKLDTVGLDTTGDGRVDTLRPIPSTFDLDDIPSSAKLVHHRAFKRLTVSPSTTPKGEPEEPVSFRSDDQGPILGMLHQPPHHAKRTPPKRTLAKAFADHGYGVQGSSSEGAETSAAHAEMCLPPAVMITEDDGPATGSFKSRTQGRRCSAFMHGLSSAAHAAEHVMGLDYDQAAHIVDVRLKDACPPTVAAGRTESEETQPASAKDMHDAAVRVQAALRGRHGRVQIEHQKKKAHSHRLLHVRFVFYHVLKHVYHSFVEDGIVPARSLLAHNLINSVDMAVDHLGLPLFDWAVIVQEVIRLPWYKRIFLPKDTFLKSDSAGGGTPAPQDMQNDAWDGVRFHTPGSMLGLASTIAAKVKRRRWTSKLPNCLVTMASAIRRAASGWAQFFRLDSLFLRLHLSEYDEHAVYVLRCFILAHQEAQRELRNNLTADDATDVRGEVVEVIQESQLAVHEARRYLRQLTLVSEQRGFKDLVDSVRSRQLAGLILSRLEAFVRRMMERGALDETDAQHLMHEFAADEERIQRKGAKMFVPARDEEKSRGRQTIPTHSHAHAVAELQRIHVSGSKRLRELQLLTKSTIAFRQAGADHHNHNQSISEESISRNGLKEVSTKRSPVITRRMKSALRTSLPISVLAGPVKHDSLARPEKQLVNEVDVAMLQEASRLATSSGHSLLSHRRQECSYTGTSTPSQATPKTMPMAGLGTPELRSTDAFALTARISGRTVSPIADSPLLVSRRSSIPVLPPKVTGTTSFGADSEFLSKKREMDAVRIKRFHTSGP